MRVVQDWISPFTWMPSPTMRVPSAWDSSWGTFGSAFERPRTPAPGRTPRPSSDAGTRRRGGWWWSWPPSFSQFRTVVAALTDVTLVLSRRLADARQAQAKLADKTGLIVRQN